MDEAASGVARLRSLPALSIMTHVHAVLLFYVVLQNVYVLIRGQGSSCAALIKIKDEINEFRKLHSPKINTKDYIKHIILFYLCIKI